MPETNEGQILHDAILAIRDEAATYMQVQDTKFMDAINRWQTWRNAQPDPVPTPTPTPTPTPAPVTNPSGQAMPVGDMPGWKQVFADDFTTDVALGQFPDAVKDRWFAYNEGWKNTNGTGTYSPHRTLSVKNNCLNINLHTDNGGVHCIAAPCPILPGTNHGATFTSGILYGRMAVRFRADKMPGYKLAWLHWPDTGGGGATNPNGELDCPEGALDGSDTIHGFMHHRDATANNDQDAFNSTVVLADGNWHTVVQEWSRDLVVYYVDGTEIGRTTNRVPNVPMHFVLQSETVLGGAHPDWGVNGNVQIDWFAYYAKV